MATKKNEETAYGLLGGVGMLIEGVTHGVKAAVQGVADNVEQGVQVLWRRLLRAFGLFFFAILGAVLLIVGFARVLDSVYQLPGLGEIIMGAFVFAGVLLVSMMEHHK